jgi:hypothetical protein
MDSDLSDGYIGAIDVRGFTAGRPPVDMSCAAGQKAGKGFMGELDDGRISMSMSFMEFYDNHDWNGDGGIGDWSTGVLVIDDVTGNCRQGANSAVDGFYPRSHGKTIMAGDQYEFYDGRDWNGDGDTNDNFQTWANIEARTDISNLVSLVGPVYTSFTFTAPVPSHGWGNFRTGITNAWHGFAYDFGITVSTNSFSPHWGRTRYTLAADEDGNPQTSMPTYYVGYGGPAAIISGGCIHMIWFEYYMRFYTSLRGIGGGYDWTGDGDYYDGLWTVFCPDETVGGTGEYIEEETSKNAAGMYRDPIPFIGHWYQIYYDGGTEFAGTTPCLVAAYEQDYYSYSIRDDADGDLRVGQNPASAGGYFYYHLNYQVSLEKPDFEILELEMVDGGYAQPGGTVLVRMVLLNTGGIDIKISEDKGLTAIPDYKLQGMSAVDLIGPDGVLIPGEVATFYFTLTISAGAGAGILGPANLQYDESVEIFVTYGGVVKSAKVDVHLFLKMFGNHLSCYRHKQNALRTMRAFDMDDDQGLLDTAKWASQMPGLDPERELLLTISWFENGCGLSGQNDVEGAHSYSSSLTGSFGMGMQYWGFAPGQEEGNEGNGNGGLTGNDRKDAYGW